MTNEELARCHDLLEAMIGLTERHTGDMVNILGLTREYLTHPEVMAEEVSQGDGLLKALTFAFAEYEG